MTVVWHEGRWQVRDADGHVLHSDPSAYGAWEWKCRNERKRRWAR